MSTELGTTPTDTSSVLTSRKLAATIAGLLAIVGTCAIAAFHGPVPSFDKVLLSETTITMTAIGAQFLIDKVR